MKNIIRIIVSLIALVLTGLAVFTLETVADELGWTGRVREAVRGGVRAVFDAGYADYVLYGAIFFSGITLAMWLDFFIRRYFSRIKKYPIVRIGWSINKFLASEWEKKLSHWVATCNIYTGKDAIFQQRASDPKFSKFGVLATIVFQVDAVPAYELSVFSSKQILWKLSEQGRHFVTLEFDFIDDESFNLEIYINSIKRLEQTSGTEQDQWNDSFVFKDHKYFLPQDNKTIDKSIMPVKPESFFPEWWDLKITKPSLLSKLRSRLGTATKKLLKIHRD